jgi:hypothetical protein
VSPELGVPGAKLHALVNPAGELAIVNDWGQLSALGYGPRRISYDFRETIGMTGDVMQLGEILSHWLLPSAVIIAFLAILFRSVIQVEKRSKALAAIAPTLGLSFEGDEWSSTLSALRFETALFDMGWDQRSRNIMRGSFGGFAITAFDQGYRIIGSRSQQPITQTVVAFTIDLFLPRFELGPEGVLDRIGDAFTQRDIDFDTNPEFSRRYVLRGGNKDKVRELFTPALLNFLEGIPPDEKWHIEGEGNTLIFYQSDLIVAADELRQLLEQTSSIAKTFLSCCGLKKPA